MLVHINNYHKKKSRIFDLLFIHYVNTQKYSQEIIYFLLKVVEILKDL